MLGSVVLTSSDLVVTGAVALLLAALAALFVATPLGKTAQAVFQSQKGAALVGIDVGAFQGGVWGLGAAMAAVGGILIAPVTLLYPDMAAFSLLRGFAAMTLGGFGSFPGAVIGALLLGDRRVAGRVLCRIGLCRHHALCGDPGGADGPPVGPVRKAPRCSGLNAGACCGCFRRPPARLPLIANQYQLYVGNLILVYALVGLGFNVLIGNLGQLAFASTTFFGVGAYTTGILMLHVQAPFLVAALAGGLVSALSGVLVSLPALRGVRGFYLAIMTLAFGELMRWIYVHAPSLTMGSTGLPVPLPFVAGYALREDGGKFYLFLALVTLLVLATSALLRSRVGRAFMAIRENELAAAAMGIPTARMIVLAFAWSGFVVGIGGALYAALVRRVSPDAFDLVELMLHFAIVVVGGLASIAGSLLGAIVLTLAPELVRDLPGFESTLLAG